LPRDTPADRVVGGRGVQARLDEQRPGVLPERRNVSHARLGPGERRGGQQRLDRRVFGSDRPPAVARAQLRVPDHLVEVLDLRGGDAGRGQPGVQVRGRPPSRLGRHERVAFGPVPHSLDVGGEPGIIGGLGNAQDLGDQRAPATVVLHADQDLAVAGRERVVGGNGAVAQPHPRRLAAGVHLGVERVPHPFDGGFEHGHLDGGALSGAPPAQQGGQDRLGAVHARRDVRRRDAGLDRGLGRARDRDEPGFGLDEHVVGLTLLHRAAQPEPGQAGHDQLRSARPQLPGLQPQPLGRPGREVLHEDIRLRRQALHDRASLARLQVDGDRFLAPVEPDEMRARAVDHVVVATREIAPVDPLHLDHPGAEVRQVPGRQRSGHRLFDRHDGNAI
jgi:hypothetical protein